MSIYTSQSVVSWRHIAPCANFSLSKFPKIKFLLKLDAISLLLFIGRHLAIRFQLFPPTLPSAIQLRLTARSANTDGAPSQAAL